MNPHWTGGRRSSFFSIHRLTNRLGQLIRTRGGLEPTADAFQTLDHFFRLHAFDETAHPLRIAITASIELHVVNNPVVDFEFNHLAAGALRIISVFHSEIDLAAKVTIIIEVCVFHTAWKPFHTKPQKTLVLLKSFRYICTRNNKQ